LKQDAAFQVAEASLRQASAQAKTAGNQLGYAQLLAPDAGVITQRLAEAGQVVTAGQSIFLLALDGEREVAISVPEQTIGAFAPGRELQVELWSSPGQFISGRLRKYRPPPMARHMPLAIAWMSRWLGQARAFTPESGSPAARSALTPAWDKRPV
jgi:multidrug efflux system membrane fusion protein